MDLLEYQGKQLFARHGVPVPAGEAARTVDEAVAAAEAIGYPCVVKAQVQIGGRGKLGGIKVCADRAQAESNARAILGMDIRGLTVHELWIEAASQIDAGYYASVIFDRSAKAPLVMLSTRGGMDIEQVAADTPDAILKQHIDPGMGLEAFQARKIAFTLGLKAQQINPAVQFLSSLYKAFLDIDSSLLEINPFITTTDGRLFALDAKITIDDNALFRHADLRELRDITEEDPLEVEASKYSLNYIKLDGSVGCMVNGAGLAMATMDIIKYAGGMPANFLDVGGGATSEQVAHAFEILLSDKNVKAVLINIFGGILRVDTLATGVVEAARKTNIKLPIVLRLEGTNVDEGKKILMNSGFNFLVTDTMKDAADKVVAAARGTLGVTEWR